MEWRFFSSLLAGVSWGDPAPLYTDPQAYKERWEAINCGFKFVTKKNPIEVTALGVWDGPSHDSNGTIGDGLVNATTVRIWAETDLTAPLVTIVIPAGSSATLKDGFRYVDLDTPLTLDPYTPYRIASQPSGGGDHVIEAHGGSFSHGLTTMNDYFSPFTLATWGRSGTNAPAGNDGSNQAWVGPNLLFNPLPPTGAPQTLIDAVAIAVQSEWASVSRLKEGTTSGLELLGPKPLTADGPFPGQIVNGIDRWENNGTEQPYIIWDLGAPEIVEHIYLWNYNTGNGWNEKRSLSNATIMVANDLDDDDPWTEVETVTLNMSTGANGDPGQFVPLSGPLPKARYVMFTNLVAYLPTDYHMGIQEIAFYRLIPEPGSLLLLGAGALLIARWRRRRR